MSVKTAGDRKDDRGRVHLRVDRASYRGLILIPIPEVGRDRWARRVRVVHDEYLSGTAADPAVPPYPTPTTGRGYTRDGSRPQINQPKISRFRYGGTAFVQLVEVVHDVEEPGPPNLRVKPFRTGGLGPKLSRVE